MTSIKLCGLADARKKNCLTQEAAAQRIGITKSYYCQLERGEKTNPTVEVLARIAKALNCGINDLIDDGSQTA